MELKRLLEITIRRWPVVLLAFVATTALTVMWTSSKPTLYESSGTYVVRARESDPDALAALLRGPEVNATYAAIARSEVVEGRAKEELGERVTGARLSIDADVVTGTNTISISAKGRDPEAVLLLAQAAGEDTIQFIRELNDPYELALVDAPDLPTTPIDNKAELVVGVGVVFGLGLGFVLAAFVDTFVTTLRTVRADRKKGRRNPAVPGEGHDPRPGGGVEPAPVAGPLALDEVEHLVVDTDPDTNEMRAAAPDSDFARALDRATRRGRAHSLGILRITRADASHANGSNGSVEVASNGASAPTPDRDADRVARLLRAWEERTGGTFTRIDDDTYAILLPDTSAASASKLLADWAEILSVVEPESGTETEPTPAGVQISIGVREYPGRSTWSAVAPTRSSPE